MMLEYEVVRDQKNAQIIGAFRLVGNFGIWEFGMGKGVLMRYILI